MSLNDTDVVRGLMAISPGITRAILARMKKTWVQNEEDVRTFAAIARAEYPVITAGLDHPDHRQTAEDIPLHERVGGVSAWTLLDHTGRRYVVLSEQDWRYIKAVLNGQEAPPESMMESIRNME